MKASKDKKSKDSTNDTSIPKKTLPKEFKWGGFKSHMMATMAKWREVNYLTDATFQCLDGKVSFHRLVVAAASPLLREAMSQDQTEELIISVPEITSAVMAAMMDLLYKGRMYITPSNTWDIRSLVEILTINAEDVSVISGSRLPPITTSASSQSPVLPASVPASKSNVTEKSATTNRKRRRQTLESVPPVASKISKTEDNTQIKTTGRKKKRKSQLNDSTNDSGNVSVASTGFHDLEDVETWVCAICKCYDPVITSPIKDDLATTEWIGCDCNRWYHQYCTKLKHIDDSFSCVQVNLKCLPM